jgi:hypothetical protein
LRMRTVNYSPRRAYSQNFVIPKTELRRVNN